MNIQSYGGVLQITLSEDSPIFERIVDYCKQHFPRMLATHDSVTLFKSEKNPFYRKKALLQHLAQLYIRESAQAQMETVQLVIDSAEQTIRIRLDHKTALRAVTTIRIDADEELRFTIKEGSLQLISKLRLHFGAYVTDQNWRQREIRVKNGPAIRALFKTLLNHSERLGPNIHFEYHKPDLLRFFDIRPQREDSTIIAYYNRLECNINDDIKIVKQRYRQLAKQYHPDNVAAVGTAAVKHYTHKFQSIQEAYEAVKAYHRQSA